jgi:hypothetical protein
MDDDEGGQDEETNPDDGREPFPACATALPDTIVTQLDCDIFNA